MTAAVEGVMDQIGFGSFHATTIWSWLIVLAMFAVFTVFIVAIATTILALYNLLSERTGMGMHVESAPRELLPGSRSDVAIAVSPDASFDSVCGGTTARHEWAVQHVEARAASCVRAIHNAAPRAHTTPRTA